MRIVLNTFNYKKYFIYLRVLNTAIKFFLTKNYIHNHLKITIFNLTLNAFMHT